ncbi:CHAP domain-containing protein [Enterobacter cancerogenus]|uniref:CHAP domain-containing protein n=1 Tax=Enterobacter cancerogenus TaxID=69218 RepID=UPI001F38670A|nr:CHAP domain-containing protein [Enterobacter cancerogenus]
MWSAHKATVYARQHAGLHSQKRCAEFVSNAIRAGGANLHNTHYAKDMKSNLILAGFHQVYGEPIEGDVAVIQATAHHVYGHACIYDGNGVWYSDFVQRTMYPGPEYREVRPAYAIYRHD